MATTLPNAFLAALAGHDEVLVTSREGSVEGSVRMWFAVGPGDVLYLFTEAFSTKARRWRDDPWVRLRIIGTTTAVEGIVRPLQPAELDDTLASLVTERWVDWGAAHPSGLRRMIAAGTHLLVRVERA